MNVWQLVLGCVTAVASITAAILSWRAGRSAIDQRENQALREEWSHRFEWAIELVLSNEEHRVNVGVVLLRRLCMNRSRARPNSGWPGVPLVIGCRGQPTVNSIRPTLKPAPRRWPTMGDTTRPKVSQVGAARAIAILDQRLGNQTPVWIMKLASTRLPFDPADQETWSPLVGQR